MSSLEGLSLPSVINDPKPPAQIQKYFTDSEYVAKEWHDEKYLYAPESKRRKPTWRLKDKLKTAGAVLVVCLNVGTDPPDVVKPIPCARKECWFDPNSASKVKALEVIGNNLLQQYEKLQSKAKYKQCLDPTSDDLRRVCMSLRKSAKLERLLFHYNGHGVPKPTENGELWVFGKHYTHYMPVAVSDLRQWLGDPAVYTLDCSGAGALVPHLVSQISDASSNDTSHNGSENGENVEEPATSIDGMSIVLAACAADENIPLGPLYPADLFTCCLTTPIQIGVRWFILQNQFSMSEVSLDLAENIPGKDNDRKTPRGELVWIFTAITDTVAWDTLPSVVFQRLFRQDLLVASLFRNFLLAKRIMKTMGCNPQSYPSLPDSSTSHPLWKSWDLAVEGSVTHLHHLQKGTLMTDSKNNMASPFFTKELNAFEVWLDFGGSGSSRPTHLPIALQVLLSQSHRMRSLVLIKRYLLLSQDSVNLALLVGIFPYILKLLQSPAPEIKDVMVSIWCSILSYDPSCRQELIRDPKSPSYFIQQLNAKELPYPQRCMSVFVLSELCRDFEEGRELCLTRGLHRSCVSILKLIQQSASDTSPANTASAKKLGSPQGLQQWIALCITKLCENYPWAKYLCVKEGTHVVLSNMIDQSVEVRAAAMLALGELFGANDTPTANNQPPVSPARSGAFGAPGSFQPLPNTLGSCRSFASATSLLNADGSAITGSATPSHDMNPSLSRQPSHGQWDTASSMGSHVSDIRQTELQLASQIIEHCTDGSPVIRRESVIALSKFISGVRHLKYFEIIAQKSLEVSNTSFQQGVVDSNSNVRNTMTGQASVPGTRCREDSLLGEISDTSTVLEALNSILEDEDNRPRHNSGDDVGYDFQMDSEGSFAAQEASIHAHRKAVREKMSMSYLRVWLGLIEIRKKDPHPMVVLAAQSILTILQNKVESGHSTQVTSPLTDVIIKSNGGPGPPSELPAMSPFTPSSPRLLHQHQQPSAFSFVPTPAGQPNHVIGSPNHGHKHIVQTNPVQKSSMLIGSPFFPQNGLGTPVNYGAGAVPVSGTPPLEMDGNAPMNRTDSAQNAAAVNIFADCLALKSPLYDWCSSQFITLDEGFSPDEDYLSVSGSNKMHCLARRADIMASVRHYNEIFKLITPVSKASSGGGMGDMSNGRSPTSDSMTMEKYFFGSPQSSRNNSAARELSVSPPPSTGKTTAAATLPQSVTKFEQKAILNIENSDMVSMILFHAYQDILALSDGDGIDIWSLIHGNKITHLNNNHAFSTSGSNAYTSNVVSGGRVTTMEWINESSDSMILVGSDDGAVRVWKDSVTPCSTASRNITGSSNVCLATAFPGLPDVAEISRGSGVVTSWDQCSGNLLVGGNSPTIRLWDLDSECCRRVFQTGLDTCTSTIASHTIFPGKEREHLSKGSKSTANSWAWTFAGFADGSVAMFDERVGSLGGRVHCSKEHKSWIVSAHLRADVPEVITGSLSGTVKFWDIRSMRTFKTIEVHKSPLTALSVHNCAPIMATGSHAQFIKILTLGGDQLGMIRYHDGFLGQRIGPVSCLAFHPIRMILAAGATDNIVSIYSTADG